MPRPSGHRTLGMCRVCAAARPDVSCQASYHRPTINDSISNLGEEQGQIYCESDGSMHQCKTDKKVLDRKESVAKGP